jgi:hypothetical protein
MTMTTQTRQALRTGGKITVGVGSLGFIVTGAMWLFSTITVTAIGFLSGLIPIIVVMMVILAIFKSFDSLE